MTNIFFLSIHPHVSPLSPPAPFKSSSLSVSLSLSFFCIHFNFLQSGDRNGTPSRRSKSEGPPLANGRCVNALENIADGKQVTDKVFSYIHLFLSLSYSLSLFLNFQPKKKSLIFHLPNKKEKKKSKNEE